MVRLAKLPSRRRGGAKATLSLTTDPTPGQNALLAEFCTLRERIEKLIAQAQRLSPDRCHLPEAMVLRFDAICCWRAELLLRRAREDEDAFLEIDWPAPEAPPHLDLRRRARAIDVVPFLRARKAGE
ncbi:MULTISPECIES: hypothetical protein [Sorangium]|uniref:Uncharacterized protein n=1 Tax=Sorangium cellulosum TaxID=56 RepID=A0A4P2QKL9_SORCE|nr:MULTISPECIES: hypothetical protein [Sorangium]AUX30500.1 uncharacterized protein SOCE836_026060 [Sorangium cellulosum]WCQ89894.1 hypothetical protein NQZ70_02592 [Sorangium sp. Soce836]